MNIAENLRPHITEITSLANKFYSDYKDVTHRLLILALVGVVAAVVVLFAGLFVDDVILRLRDDMFSLVLAGVKLTLGTLGYELVEHNIRGVLQLEGGHLFIVTHSKLHIRYYMLAFVVLLFSIKNIKKADFAAAASVPALWVLAVEEMSLKPLTLKRKQSLLFF